MGFHLRGFVERREFLKEFFLAGMARTLAPRCDAPHLAEGDEVYVSDLQCRKGVVKVDKGVLKPGPSEEGYIFYCRQRRGKEGTKV